MTLLELLVKELPGRGGWPDLAHHATKNSNFTHVYFYDEVGNPPEQIELISIFMGITSDTETITHEQYEAAIAAQQPIAEFHSKTFPSFNAITVTERADSWIGKRDDGEDYHCYKYCWDIEFINQQPAWNGEGLPPVGIEIEYKFTKVSYRSDFSRGKVLAYGIQSVFMEHWSSKNEFIHSLDHIEFRPIRTEAERKRGEAINAIALAYDTQDKAGNYRGATGVYEDIAAGKIPGVELSK